MQNNLSSRVKRINIIYSFYLQGLSVEEFMNSKEFKDNSSDKKLVKIFENFQSLEDKAIPHLTGWSWDRTSELERAIIISGISEITFQKQKIGIVVSEHNKYIKKYIGKEVQTGYIQSIFNKVK